jgi:predicted XRE-type DNA-binding protein
VAAEAHEALPEANQACIAEVKKALLGDIQTQIRALFETQQQAADALDIEQPTVSCLMSGRIERFSINWLVMTATRLGLNIEIGTTPCER